MSMHGIERVFWEFGNDPTNIERFRQDPDAFLCAYNLEEEERLAIKEVNLKRLSEQGLSPLLALMIWPLLSDTDGLPASFLQHMNGGELPELGGKQS